MASPAHSSHSSHRIGYPVRVRRSSFNGPKQLAAAQAPSRRVLLVVGFLLVALAVAIGTIAYHMASS